MARRHGLRFLLGGYSSSRRRKEPRSTKFDTSQQSCFPPPVAPRLAFPAGQRWFGERRVTLMTGPRWLLWRLALNHSLAWQTATRQPLRITVRPSRPAAHYTLSCDCSGGCAGASGPGVVSDARQSGRAGAKGDKVAQSFQVFPWLFCAREGKYGTHFPRHSRCWFASRIAKSFEEREEGAVSRLVSRDS